MKKEDTKAVAKAPKVKKEKPAKQPKAPKTYDAKKLPKLFKKAYTQKQFEKKIIKKLYIPEDQKFLTELFKEAGQNKKGVELLKIPADRTFEKKELNRLATLAVEIKNNKGRIKILPLIATIAFIAAVVITIALTKNIVARKVITSTCESIFEAKCDIDYLNISILKSTFNMKGWQVANKKEPMKNLFSVESVTFDFDLNQLLKARFVANELSVLGVETNTDRKSSGDISAKRLAKIQKKKEKAAKKKAKQAEKSAFMTTLESKANGAMDTLKSSISGVFDQYNPENIMKEVQEQLQTPAVSKQVQEQAKTLTDKYKAKPEQIKTKLEQLKTSSEALTSLDVEALKSNPAKIKEAIDNISTVRSSLDTLKTEATSTLNDIQSDINGVGGLAKQIQNAIENDKGLVEKQINKFSSLNLDSGKKFISGTFDSIIYQLLGKYYPYYTKALELLEQAKNNSKEKEKKPKKEKKAYTIQRAAGRDVVYKNDSAPKFWIKKAAGSGSKFAFDAHDITNNMDLTGKPATANVTASLFNMDHKAKIVVDTRKDSKEPLVLTNYNCDKVAIAYPAEKLGNIPGVPGIDSSVSQLDFIFKIFENDGFSLSGTSYFRDLVLSAPQFEPEFVYNIYNNTLQKITTMKLGVETGFTQSSGLALNLITDADKQFMNAFMAEMTNQLGAIKEKVEAQMFEKINEYSNGALGEINSFNDISDKVNGYKKEIDALYNKIEAKRRELEEAAVGKAKAAADKAVNDAKDKANDAAKSAFKKLF